MQYIGLSDLIGGFIDRLPDYAVRFGSFLLNTVRRFVMNPWGFVTMLVGAVIAIDMLDEAIVNITNSIKEGVQMVQNSLINWVNSITVRSCGFYDYVCYVEAGLSGAVKVILSVLFTYIVQPILTFVEFIMNSINYTAKIIFYSISSFLCNFINKFYSVITGAYASYRVFRSIGSSILYAFTRGRLLDGVFGGVFAPFIVYIITSSIANTLLNFILSQFGVNCNTLSVPSTTQTKLPTISVTAVQSVGSTATYSLYTKSTGAPPQHVYDSAKYAFTQLTVSTLKPVAYEDASYSFTALTRLPVTESISDYARYGFTVIPPAFLTILTNGTDAFTVESMIIIPVTLSDNSNYVFKVITGVGTSVLISDSASYSVSILAITTCNSTVSSSTPTSVGCESVTTSASA